MILLGNNHPNKLVQLFFSVVQWGFPCSVYLLYFVRLSPDYEFSLIIRVLLIIYWSSRFSFIIIYKILFFFRDGSMIIKAQSQQQLYMSKSLVSHLVARLLLPADQKPNEKWTIIAKFSGVPCKVTLRLCLKSSISRVGINCGIYVYAIHKFVNLVREVMAASVFSVIFCLACISADSVASVRGRSYIYVSCGCKFNHHHLYIYACIYKIL